MEHVIIRRLEHLTGNAAVPSLGFAVETRDRRGPAHKEGVFGDDVVWVQLHGGLFVAKAKVRISWVGEYSNIREIRARTSGAPIFDVDDFWAKRPKFGYAVVAQLEAEQWIKPYWAGPRTYGYEWVVMDESKKKASWLDKKDPPSGGNDFIRAFSAFKAGK
ncbi:MAG: hypothetical protein ACR2FO_03395 [Actinomycetota bacterium]